jgi:hypothetical protein
LTVGLIVLGEAIYIRQENGAARGWAEEAEREEVMRDYLLAPANNWGLDDFGCIRHRGSASQKSDRAAAEKK